jgi:rhodanese-related sulfurtransferase
VEIGLFQLENLLQTRSPCVFLDLRKDSTREPSNLQLAAILRHATPSAASAVEGLLVRLAKPKEFPILLVCEDGATSSKVAQTLESKGFVNVYPVSGGVQGLLGELTSS